jgi:hypothetical protein
MKDEPALNNRASLCHFKLHIWEYTKHLRRSDYLTACRIYPTLPLKRITFQVNLLDRQRTLYNTSRIKRAWQIPAVLQPSVKYMSQTTPTSIRAKSTVRFSRGRKIYVTIFGRKLKSEWGRLSSVRCKYTLLPTTWKTVYWDLTCRYKSHDRILFRSSDLTPFKFTCTFSHQKENITASTRTLQLLIHKKTRNRVKTDRKYLEILKSNRKWSKTSEWSQSLNGLGTRNA